MGHLEKREKKERDYEEPADIGVESLRYLSHLAPSAWN
jgi:hypothetical protein